MTVIGSRRVLSLLIFNFMRSFLELLTWLIGQDTFTKTGVIAGVDIWVCKALNEILLVIGIGSWIGRGCCTKGCEVGCNESYRDPWVFSSIILVCSSIIFVSLISCPFISRMLCPNSFWMRLMVLIRVFSWSPIFQF